VESPQTAVEVPFNEEMDVSLNVGVEWQRFGILLFLSSKVSLGGMDEDTSAGAQFDSIGDEDR